MMSLAQDLYVSPCKYVPFAAKIDTPRDEGEETLEKCKRDPMYL